MCSSLEFIQTGQKAKERAEKRWVKGNKSFLYRWLELKLKIPMKSTNLPEPLSCRRNHKLQKA